MGLGLGSATASLCFGGMRNWVRNISWFVCCSHCTAEVSPVCAIVGGIVGQEIVKVSKSFPTNVRF